MDLVDDHSIDRAKRAAGVRGEEQVERFRGGDEDVRWLPQKPGALDGGSIARANGDGGLMKRVASRHRSIRDAGNWGAKVSFDVHRERFERRNIENPASLIFGRYGVEHDPVDAPEKRRQGFPAARRCKNQRRFAVCNRWPPLRLRRRRPRKRIAEPFRGGGMKKIEGSGTSSHVPILLR